MIPTFINTQQESDFWDEHDATDYLEATEAVTVEFVDDRDAQETMLIQLEPTLIEKLTEMARQKGIPPQSLLRVWIMERLSEEGV